KSGVRMEKRQLHGFELMAAFCDRAVEDIEDGKPMRCLGDDALPAELRVMCGNVVSLQNDGIIHLQQALMDIEAQMASIAIMIEAVLKAENAAMQKKAA
ncbi:MAG: hypothetical protein WCL61_03470, partial [bacterium]